MDYLVFLTLVTGTSRKIQIATVTAGLLFALYGHWLVGGLIWGFTLFAWQITKRAGL